MLEEAVYEEGIAYFRGEKSLEDAVNAIEKKVSLYLAEQNLYGIEARVVEYRCKYI